MKQPDGSVNGQLKSILLGSMFLEKLFQSLRIEERFHDATDHDAEGNLRNGGESRSESPRRGLSKKILESVDNLGTTSMGASIGVGAGSRTSTDGGTHPCLEDITGYADGYFWGEAVTQLGSSSTSNSSMLGSVTPQSRILLTFRATSTNSSPSITNGYGTMLRKYGQWTMENQMVTSPNETLQIGHWAYMLQTRPGMASRYSAFRRRCGSGFI
jgi:hypothetical protein